MQQENPVQVEPSPKANIRASRWQEAATRHRRGVLLQPQQLGTYVVLWGKQPKESQLTRSQDGGDHHGLLRFAMAVSRLLPARRRRRVDGSMGCRFVGGRRWWCRSPQPPGQRARADAADGVRGFGSFFFSFSFSFSIMRRRIASVELIPSALIYLACMRSCSICFFQVEQLESFRVQHQREHHPEHR